LETYRYAPFICNIPESEIFTIEVSNENLKHVDLFQQSLGIREYTAWHMRIKRIWLQTLHRPQNHKAQEHIEYPLNKNNTKKKTIRGGKKTIYLSNLPLQRCQIGTTIGVCNNSLASQ